MGLAERPGVFFGPVDTAFRTPYPRVELKLFEMTISEQIQALREEEVDIGLLRPPISDDNLESRLVGTQKFVVALPRSHPHAQAGRISLSALKDNPFVLFERQLIPNRPTVA